MLTLNFECRGGGSFDFSSLFEAVDGREDFETRGGGDFCRGGGGETGRVGLVRGGGTLFGDAGGDTAGNGFTFVVVLGLWVGVGGNGACGALYARDPDKLSPVKPEGDSNPEKASSNDILRESWVDEGFATG